MENLDEGVFGRNSINGIDAKKLLSSIVLWSKITSILSCLTSIAVFLFCLFLVFTEKSLDTLEELLPSVFISTVPLSFLIPSIYLFLFALRIQKALNNSDEVVFQLGLQKLKSFIISLGLTVIFFVASILAFLIYIGGISSEPVNDIYF